VSEAKTGEDPGGVSLLGAMAIGMGVIFCTAKE
jgi:hypothetical protein